MPGRHHIRLEPLEPVFCLDGFKYYYDEKNRVYWAVEPDIRCYSFSKIEHFATFALDSDFHFVKSITKPTEVRLLRMKHTIQIHQVMES